MTSTDDIITCCIKSINPGTQVKYIHQPKTMLILVLIWLLVTFHAQKWNLTKAQSSEPTGSSLLSLYHLHSACTRWFVNNCGHARNYAQYL
jgi:hypothetical protein